MKFLWICILILLPLNAFAGSGFAVSEGDKFTYNLAACQRLIDGEIEPYMEFYAKNEVINLYQGTQFFVEMVNLETSGPWDLILIEISAGEDSLQIEIGFSGASGEFLITTDWNQFRENQIYPFDTDHRAGLDTNTEIGYYEARIERFPGGTFTSFGEYYLDMRYSKSDGVLNYYYYLSSEGIEYSDGSILYNYLTEIEFIRNNYDPVNHEFETSSEVIVVPKIHYPWLPSLGFLLVIPMLRRQRNR